MKKKIYQLASELNQKQILKKIPTYQSEDLYQSLSWLKSSKNNRAKSFLSKKNPLKKVPFYENKTFLKSGNYSIAKGEVSCVILAGGEGSRFKSNKPKGCVPIFEKKSLFELLIKRIQFKQTELNVELTVGIMTSSKTHEKTSQFLKTHHFFGLKRSQVCIFQQNNFPVLSSPYKRLFLHQKEIASMPNGNGGLIEALHQKKVFSWFLENKIKYLQVCSIDNPLVDPFDPYLIGFQKQKKHDIVVQCFERINSDESLGILFKKENNIAIQDYLELDEKLYRKKIKGNTFYYPYANVGHYSFSFSFLKKLKKKILPIHWTQKKTRSFGKEKMVWKAEIFLFDVFKYATSCGALYYPRELCYASLKQKTGPNGILALQTALKNSQKKYFS